MRRSALHITDAILIIAFAGFGTLALVRSGILVHALATFEPSASVPADYKSGDSLPKHAGLAFDGETYSLLLVLRPGCSYCTASIPFYNQLAAEPAEWRQRVRLVAVCLGSSDTCERYVEEQGLLVDGVITTTPLDLGINRTPTVVLADGTGQVIGSWLGLQRAAGQEDIQRTLSQLPRT